jgi:hypothetical protein
MYYARAILYTHLSTLLPDVVQVIVLADNQATISDTRVHYLQSCISQHQDAAAFNMMLNVPVYIHTLISPATTKVAECPQLPLRWLNVTSYPEVVECHSANSHTVIIHEYTIYNTMYYPISGCSDQAFNMMIGGHSKCTHCTVYQLP